MVQFLVLLTCTIMHSAVMQFLAFSSSVHARSFCRPFTTLVKADRSTENARYKPAWSCGIFSALTGKLYWPCLLILEEFGPLDLLDRSHMKCDGNVQPDSQMKWVAIQDQVHSLSCWTYSPRSRTTWWPSWPTWDHRREQPKDPMMISRVRV
jgi:hypothetical protein